MKIEVWSDYICPFCYIGKRHLEDALAQFPDKDHVEIEFRSFELDPSQPIYTGGSIHQMLAQKYGMSIEQAKNSNTRVGQQAAKIGLTYHFDEMKPTNTFDAHRLTKYAKAEGKEKEITEKILYAYFTESKLISDHETLAQIAESVGLNEEKALTVLKNSESYAGEVRADETFARQIKVTGVPFFLINQKYAVSGAQPVEVFVDALKQVWQEESEESKIQKLSPEGSGENACEGGNCPIL